MNRSCVDSCPQPRDRRTGHTAAVPDLRRKDDDGVANAQDRRRLSAVCGFTPHAPGRHRGCLSLSESDFARAPHPLKYLNRCFSTSNGWNSDRKLSSTSWPSSLGCRARYRSAPSSSANDSPPVNRGCSHFQDGRLSPAHLRCGRESRSLSGNRVRNPKFPVRNSENGWARDITTSYEPRDPSSRGNTPL